MGLFGESSKEREAREERALAALLKGFEESVKKPEKATDPKKTAPNASQEKKADSPSPEAAPRPATVEDLAEFLARKGVLSLSEWENHKSKQNLA